eukprot:14048810-Ditylum_brightwellii.AAC.2
MKDEETGNTYQKVNVTFQSTSSCNIQAINILNKVSLFKDSKERGMGENKCKWVIEMNKGRQLYLNMYYKVDVIGHFIKNMRVAYQS